MFRHTKILFFPRCVIFLWPVKVALVPEEAHLRNVCDVLSCFLYTEPICWDLQRYLISPAMKRGMYERYFISSDDSGSSLPVDDTHTHTTATLSTFEPVVEHFIYGRCQKGWENTGFPPFEKVLPQIETLNVEILSAEYQWDNPQAEMKLSTSGFWQKKKKKSTKCPVYLGWCCIYEITHWRIFLYWRNEIKIFLSI